MTGNMVFIEKCSLQKVCTNITSVARKGLKLFYNTICHKTGNKTPNKKGFSPYLYTINKECITI